MIRGQYGAWEVTGYDGPWRRELYHPDDGRRPIEERSMCTGRDDRSPHHATYPTGYDARCGCCWLNIPHTEAFHAKETK